MTSAPGANRANHDHIALREKNSLPGAHRRVDDEWREKLRLHLFDLLRGDFGCLTFAFQCAGNLIERSQLLARQPALEVFPIRCSVVIMRRLDDAPAREDWRQII